MTGQVCGNDHVHFMAGDDSMDILQVTRDVLLKAD
jgi:hypothetical protein